MMTHFFEIARIIDLLRSNFHEVVLERDGIAFKRAAEDVGFLEVSTESGRLNFTLMLNHNLILEKHFFFINLQLRLL